MAKATTVYEGACPSCGGAYLSSQGPPICSFPGCKKTMPPNDDRPADGWAYVVITRYSHSRIKKENLWTCPQHSVAIVPRQAGLLDPR